MTAGARRQSVLVGARPPGTNKSVLKEGPGGKQIDSDALQDTAQEYVQKVQVHTPFLLHTNCHSALCDTFILDLTLSRCTASRWLAQALGMPPMPELPGKLQLCGSAALHYCHGCGVPVKQATCWQSDHRWLQNWWEGVEEKPAAVAIIVGAITGVWALSGLVDAIDKLPIIGGLLEVIGLIVTGWFVYRYLLFEPDRCGHLDSRHLRQAPDLARTLLSLIHMILDRSTIVGC